MGRLVLAGVLVTSTVGVAGAGPTRKVKVETTPPGAAVYIDSLENGASCDATPCTIDVPIGQKTLIVQLAKHEPEFEQVDVVKGKKPINISIKLKGAVGTLIINSPKGATVRVNDEDQGKVPVTVEVPAEPVRVQVTLAGKTLHDDFVEVDTGSELELKVKPGGVKTATAPKGDDDGEDSGNTSEDGEDGSDTGEDGEDGETDSGGAVTAGVTSQGRANYLQAGLAFDIGFRRFVFSDGTSPFANSGEVLLGPAVELWPGRMAGIRPLRGLSLFARLQFAVSHQNVTRDNMGTPEDVGASTFWGALEVSLRQKWVFGMLGVEASAGYVREQVEFSADNDMVLMQVPSADYKSIRIGARVSLVSKIEPYLSAENRVVLDGGELANRADRADPSGYRLAAGVMTKLGPLGARVEGALAQYTWTFANDDATPTPSGASDKLFWISFVLGYQY